VTRVQIDQALRDARMDEALLDEVRAKLALRALDQSRREFIGFVVGQGKLG
jgi:hypothetical protein